MKFGYSYLITFKTSQQTEKGFVPTQSTEAKGGVCLAAPEKHQSLTMYDFEDY